MGKRIGVSSWMLDVPVTSAANYCLGPQSVVKVVRYDWKAKTLNWGIVVGPSDSNKSGAYAKIQKVVEALETQINDEIKAKVIDALVTGKVLEGSEEWDEAWKRSKIQKSDCRRSGKYLSW
jgi:hypothetical protein